MAYRDNELGTVLRAEYEGAKATLEEMARNKMLVRGSKGWEENSACLHNALVDLGFRKEIYLSQDIVINDGDMYIRGREEGLEILANKNISKTINAEQELHLYQLPAGQTIREAYGFIENNENQRDVYKQTGADLGCLIGAFIGGSFPIMMGGEPEQAVGIILLTSVIGFGLGRSFGRKLVPSLLVAKGPDALRYIADNTSFDDYVSYQQLRSEEFVDENNIELIEEEFVDEADVELIEEQQAGLEAVAEEKNQN